MLFLLKLTVTPLLVGLMSLAVRRWGPTSASILMGLPWMTGPMLFILGLDRGPEWVARTCIGVELGVVALATFVSGYAFAARRHGWLVAQVTGTVAFFVVGLPISRLDVTSAPAAVVASLALFINYRLIKVPADARAPGQLPWWDIPARMLATAFLVVVIALTADELGPVLSGIVSTFPVIMTVIGTFTHARWGGGAATVLLRAILVSMLSFVLFFVVVAETVVALGLAQAYLWATLTSLVTSAAILVVRRMRLVR